MFLRKRITLISRAFGIVLAALVAASVVLGGRPDAGDTHPFRQCWQYKLDGGEAVGADASSVYVSVSPAVVRAIDIRSGRDVWSSDLGGSVISNLLVTDESVYVVSGQNTQTSDEKAVLRSLSKQTGITNWTAELPATQRAWLGADAGVVVAVNESGTITAVSISEHSVRWTAHAGGLDAEPVISDGKLLVDSADNRTSVFSAGDGRQSSVFLSKFGATAVSFLFDDKVGIGDERGNIYLYNEDESSPVWVHKNGAKIASIQMTEEGALTASNDNFLYLMSAAGDIVWKRRLPARPSIRPLIFDKFAFVAASGEKNLYVVNLKNGKFADQINFESEIVSSVLIPGNGGVAVLEPGYVARISTHENCSK